MLRSSLFLAALMAGAFALSAEQPSPQGGQKVTALTPADSGHLREQEAAVLVLLRKRYGNVALKHSEADHELLQRLIDDKALAPTQTYELQCLGVVLGQVFSSRTPFHWVMVEDQYGRDPALEYPNTTVIIFPLTMISKRVEDGREVKVASIYRAVLQRAQEIKADPSYRK